MTDRGCHAAGDTNVHAAISRVRSSRTTGGRKTKAECVQSGACSWTTMPYAASQLRLLAKTSLKFFKASIARCSSPTTRNHVPADSAEYPRRLPPSNQGQRVAWFSRWSHGRDDRPIFGAWGVGPHRTWFDHCHLRGPYRLRDRSLRRRFASQSTFGRDSTVSDLQWITKSRTI